MAEERQHGTVKWFNKEKGWGFLTKDGDGTDIFVHSSQIHTGWALEEGERVEFFTRKSDSCRGIAAEDVRLLEEE